MARALQRVASLGVVSSVNVITRSTSSSATDRGRPLRGSSNSPSSLRSTNRDRHLPTVAPDTPRSAPTAVLLRPVAPAKIIRTRSAKACAVFGRSSHRSRVACSVSSKINYRTLENIKKYPDISTAGETVCITEKLHGTWCCIARVGGQPLVTSLGLSEKGLSSRTTKPTAGTCTCASGDSARKSWLA